MVQAYISKIDARYVEKVQANMHDLIMSNGDKLGVGKYPPKGFEVGDYVQYETEMKGQYKNLKAGSLSKLAKPEGVAPSQAVTPKASYGGGAYSDDRQKIISRQAALNSALTFVDLLIKTESLPLAKSVKTDDRADIVQKIVAEYTSHFYKQATGETFDIPGKGVAADLASAEASDVDWQSE